MTEQTGLEGEEELSGYARDRDHCCPRARDLPVLRAAHRGELAPFGALALAATTYLVSMALLKRVVRPQAAMDWRRMSIAFPFMGALAGGAYTLVSTASGIAAAVTGVVWGLIHLWLSGARCAGSPPKRGDTLCAEPVAKGAADSTGDSGLPRKCLRPDR